MQILTAGLKQSEQTLRRVALLALLYLIPTVQAMLPITDPDIWWHIRVGEWIAEHHAVPFEDYFSAYGMGKPWIAYSWLFEVLVYELYAKFGLSGVVYFVVAMGIVIAFAAHQLVRRAGLPIQAEVALAALALGAMKPLMSPRPWLFTILFFAIELLIITRVRHSGKDRLLWLLPLLFIIWANIHIQFVYGLAVVGLLLGESLLKNYGSRFKLEIESPPLSPGRLALVTLACAFATLLTPYHYVIFRPFLEYVGQTGAFQNISEFHPMFFRSPTDWFVLFLTISAAFALGWQRKRLLFPTLLLLMAAFLAYRARRDAWVLALVALALIEESVRLSGWGKSFQFSKWQIALGAVGIAVAIYLVSLGRGISEENLQAAVEKKYPVGAVNYVKANRLTGPLFNHLDWGGFLIWSLRELPVSMDGRTNLFGDERIERSLKTWQAGPGWESDPDLLKARLVISDKGRPLVSQLRDNPRYKIVFEDSTAVVFVPVR